jgi:hypothetical protein
LGYNISIAAGIPVTTTTVQQECAKPRNELKPHVPDEDYCAALKVTEVWRRDEDGTITIECLGDDGQYIAVESSRFLGVRPDEVKHWLKIGASTERAEWWHRLKEWIATELKPRVGSA